MIALGDVIAEAQSGFACSKQDPNGIFQFRMNNVSNTSHIVLDKRRRVPRDAHKKISAFEVQPGDVLFNATNSPDGVGKSILMPPLDEPAVFSNHFLRLRPDPDRLNATYLWRWLQQQFHLGVFRSICRQWVNQATVDRERLLTIEFELPPLDEQRRIAAILDQADALRAKRCQVLAHLDALTQSIFHDMFGDRDLETVLLGEIADVTSGVTKGRRTSEPTSPVPYLAVANVQAGHLKMDVVKEINVTAREAERYALRDGDVLLTEGGDPDKLGRGTVWRGELPLCLHQNHIFRVRIRDWDRLHPEYLAAFVAGRTARAYFLRSAKQTTGIASINMAQLRALPVALPSRSEQAEFIECLDAVRRQIETTRRLLTAHDELFACLQARAFRGEL